MSSNPSISILDLSKTYCLYDHPADRLKQSLFRGRKYYREHVALKSLSLDIFKGETVGVVGRNGSGKSTLLQLLCGTLTPSSGDITAQGRISALLELGAGFNPDFSGRENVYLNGAILGLSREELDAKYEQITAFAAIGDVLERPVKTYSSGMYVRLAFAVAVASDPDILVVDEALAVGDEAFQRKCFARIREIQERGGTILFVSHAAATIMQVCTRTLLLDQGELLMDAGPKEVLDQYHRLIFAAPESVPEIREQIRGGIRTPSRLREGEGGGNATHATVAAPLPTSPRGPRLRGEGEELSAPESMMEYESQGARIADPQILDHSGAPVNLLRRGEEYVYTYTVRYDEAFTGVRCGMVIKAKSGVELGGAMSQADGDAPLQVAAGATLRMRFRFRCVLLPGAYFINAGTSALVDGERRFLHRIIDACMFKVLPEPRSIRAGMVDFDILPDWEELPA